MKHKELFKLLDDIQEQGEEPTLKRHDKVLLIDGLNLFFRNFASGNPQTLHNFFVVVNEKLVRL